MKINKLLNAAVVAALFTTSAFSQVIVEKTQDLSKNSAKGYFYDAVQDPTSGNIEVTYKYKKSSKDADATYETYSFDKNLNFIKNEETKVNIEAKQDYTKTYVYASVGGCSSFTILSMKLHLTSRTMEYKWNHDKKKFIGKKTNEVDIKPANDEKESYSGYASFDVNETGNMMVLVSSEKKGSDGKMKKDFLLLEVKTDLSTREIPLPLEASQLVYCTVAKKFTNSDSDESEYNTEGSIDNADMVFIFAPTYDKKSTADYSKYTYLRVDKNGEVKENFKFTAPSANLIISASGQAADGSMYYCGSYSKEKDCFDQLYKEYSPLANPCYSGGVNYRMDTYESKIEKTEMNYFSMLKFKDGKNEWIKNTSIEDLGKLVQTPPKQKKAPAYNGKRFGITNYVITPGGDIFISGQLLSRNTIDKVSFKTYKDIVCLQISSDGVVKAQYGVQPESVSDKLNTIFQIPQAFIPSGDGNTLFWNLMETKTIKGYDSFFDAYNGRETFYSNYYPSMLKVNTSNYQIQDYKILGDRKYLVNKKVPYIYNKADKTVYYIGSDKKSKLWLAKYTMND